MAVTVFPGPHVRTSDPDTSRMAVPANITLQAMKVLFAYRTGLALLDIEAYARVHMVGHQRCTDLRRAGFIERVGKKLMPSGKPGYLCRITTAGRDFLRAFIEKVLARRAAAEKKDVTSTSSVKNP
jgi:hypothetical protein